MKKQLEKRLKELKAEFESGQQKLAELEAQATNLQNTLLRISGAVQVLEEELGKADSTNGTHLQQPSDLELESKEKVEAVSGKT